MTCLRCLSKLALTDDRGLLCNRHSINTLEDAEKKMENPRAAFKEKHARLALLSAQGEPQMCREWRCAVVMCSLALRILPGAICSSLGMI